MRSWRQINLWEKTKVFYDSSGQKEKVNRPPDFPTLSYLLILERIHFIDVLDGNFNIYDIFY